MYHRRDGYHISFFNAALGYSFSYKFYGFIEGEQDVRDFPCKATVCMSFSLPGTFSRPNSSILLQAESCLLEVVLVYSSRSDGSSSMHSKLGGRAGETKLDPCSIIHPLHRIAVSCSTSVSVEREAIPNAECVDRFFAHSSDSRCQRLQATKRDKETSESTVVTDAATKSGCHELPSSPIPKNLQFSCLAASCSLVQTVLV